jgi:hypothetical protein
MSDLLPPIVARPIARRAFMGGMAATGLLALPGCATVGGFSLTDAVQRLLFLSSERAFARMLQPEGYWDEQVARLGLGQLLGTRGDVLGRILTSPLFKSRLEGAFADIVYEGAERAAPLVTDAVRTIGIRNAIDLVRGGPTAATVFLRGELGTRLVEAMVPELGQAMRVASDPLVGQALAALSGVDVPQVAARVATTIDDTIWREIGAEEAAIRANPRATNDPLIIGVFGAGARL